MHVWWCGPLDDPNEDITHSPTYSIPAGFLKQALKKQHLYLLSPRVYPVRSNNTRLAVTFYGRVSIIMSVDKSTGFYGRQWCHRQTDRQHSTVDRQVL